MGLTILISEEIGEELADYGYYSNGGGEPVEIEGHKYTYVDIVEDYEDHRWNSTDQIIFKRDDGKLFALNYDIGKTENQENGFMYNTPELYEVVKKEKVVTTVNYETVK